MKVTNETIVTMVRSVLMSMLGLALSGFERSAQHLQVGDQRVHLRGQDRIAVKVAGGGFLAVARFHPVARPAAEPRE